MPKVLVFGVHDQLGGVETYCKNMVANVVGWTFDFVSTFPTMCFEDYFIGKGCRVLKVSDFHKNPFAYYSDVNRILRDNKYDVVYYNMLSSANVMPLSIARKHHVKHIVAHAHNAGTPNASIKGTLNCLQRKRTTRLATDLFSCSDRASDWMFGTRDHVTVVPNWVDTSVFKFNTEKRKTERKRLQINDNTVVVGTVGRFTKQKNQSFLIDIFRAFHSSVPNSVLILVGGGELKKTSRIRSVYRNWKTQFCLKNHGLISIMHNNSFDVFILTSLFEGLPIALIVAQACGLPFLAAKTISTEAKVADSGVFLSLDDSAMIWAGELAKAVEGQNRENISRKVMQSKWDLSYQTTLLNTLFEKMR